MTDARPRIPARAFPTRTLGILVAVALLAGVGLFDAGMGGPGHGSAAAPAARPAASATAPNPLAGWDGHTVAQREATYASLVRGGEASAVKALVAHGYSAPLAAHVYTYLVGHPEAVFSTFDLGGLENGLIAAGIGCTAGGFIGTLAGGPVGAGVGCAVGAVGMLLLIAYLGTSSGGLGIRNEDAFVRGQMTAFSNYQNITAAAFTNYLSGWNSTLFAWENAADAAAVSQVGNSTFNYEQDIGMSYVGYQFNAMSYPAVGQTGAAMRQANQVMYSAYSPSGLSNTYDYIVFGNGACFGGGTCSPGWYGGVGTFETVSGGTAGALISILKNATFSVGCLTGQNGSLLAASSGKVVLTFNNSSGHVGNIVEANWTGTDGAYVLLGSASATTGCSITGTGVLAIPSSPFAGTTSTGITTLMCGVRKVPGTCNPLLHPVIVGSQPDTAQSVNSSGPFNLQPVYTFLGGSMLAWKNQFTSMLTSVESNAYTYWAFLRSLGYTSVGSIPSGCLIPYPDLSTPPFNANTVGLTVNDTMALYGAMLNSLAVFYNVAPGTSTFCKGHAAFTFGAQAGPLLGENITGFVLTLPQGTHQKWKVPYTWALNGSNPGITAQFSIAGSTNRTPIGLVLWPTTRTVKIPLGVVVQVASNNPLDLMVPQTFTQYTLYGNGTPQTDGGTLGTSTTSGQAGVAIYLTSCVINSIAQNPCVLNYTTITTFIGNISCNPDCSSGSGFVFPNGGACGTTVPILGTIVNGVAGFVSGVPVLGSLACDIGWLVAFVVALVVLVVIVYIVGLVVRRD